MRRRKFGPGSKARKLGYLNRSSPEIRIVRDYLRNPRSSELRLRKQESSEGASLCAGETLIFDSICLLSGTVPFADCLAPDRIDPDRGRSYWPAVERSVSRHVATPPDWSRRAIRP
jgi:hypothetical protein